MSSGEYKDVLDSIRQCILATDLAAFFPNLKRINKLVLETSQFDWNDESHRVLGQSFCMTGADLSASAKPFEAQLQTVEIIFDEFYQQGDLERQAGRSPIAMMDRRRQDQLPSCQVGFLSQICLPCYTILAALFPKTKPMVEMVTANLENWKARSKELEKSKEE
ncbi:probable 3',5'-cyclic phosphodiesterase pde-5 [Cydia amplana]